MTGAPTGDRARPSDAVQALPGTSGGPVDEAAAAACLQEALRLLHAGHARTAAESARTALAHLAGASAVRRVNPLLVLGRALLDDGRYAEALDPLEQALTGCRPPVGTAGHAAQRVAVLTTLAAALRTSGRYADAARLLDEADELLAVWPDAELAVDVLAERGLVAKYAGRPAEAVALQQRVLAATTAAVGDEHPEVATVLHNLAGALHAAGDAAGALPHARRAVAVRTAALGPHHPATVADRAALAGVLVDLGALDEAEELLQGVLADHRDRHGDEHHEVAVTLHNLGCLAARRGDTGTARRLLTRALRTKQAVLGVEHPETLTTTRALSALPP
jgi:tetratricopeptide (TPR) repeat protein